MVVVDDERGEREGEARAELDRRGDGRLLDPADEKAARHGAAPIEVYADRPTARVECDVTPSWQAWEND